MRARSVARELALFVLFQSESKGKDWQWDKLSLEEMIVLTVRSLSDLAREELETVAEETASLHEFLVDYELSHPENEYLPLEVPTRPVPLPNTKEMGEKLERLLNAINELHLALELPEVNALSNRADVQNYCLMLVRNVLRHQDEIDQMIDNAATDWRVERLQKMDKSILRLAIAELKFSENVDKAIVIDEFLDLANRFTQEESRKFINGILGAIVENTENTPEATRHV